MRRVLLVIGLLLVFAPAAHAGGWATVGLSSTPDSAAPGKPWVVDLTVLQHGRTPLVGVEPVITITGAGGATHAFAARPTAKDGVYRAQVVFPAAGRWEYQVDDGFGRAHSYPAVEVDTASRAPATAATTTTDDGGPSVVWLIGGIALLLAAAVLLIRPRLRRRGHQPQAA